MIDVQQLTRTFITGEVETHALNGVSFTIQPGEFVAIMGPSGSGKSTLLHILGFLDRQTGGEYSFEGKSIQDYTELELAHIRNKQMGFVFQEFNLLPRDSIYDNIRLPLLYSQIPEREWDQRITAAIQAVGLTHRTDYQAYRLSGGERQRVAIARALINNPSVIFADEPTGNLDTKSGQAIMEILQRLNQTQKHTIVLITHETETAEHAERIIRMRDGKMESDTKVKRRLTASEFKK